MSCLSVGLSAVPPVLCGRPPTGLNNGVCFAVGVIVDEGGFGVPKVGILSRGGCQEEKRTTEFTRASEIWPYDMIFTKPPSMAAVLQQFCVDLRKECCCCCWSAASCVFRVWFFNQRILARVYVYFAPAPARAHDDGDRSSTEGGQDLLRWRFLTREGSTFSFPQRPTSQMPREHLS